MTDPGLAAKKLARIERCVADLAAVDLDRIADDLVVQRFVEHTLQVAIQAALDLGSHVVSDDRLGEPRSNREVFALLARSGWIEAPLADRLGRMAGFRNVLVHAYDEVDLAVVEDVARHHTGDLLAFASAVRARLG